MDDWCDYAPDYRCSLPLVVNKYQTPEVLRITVLPCNVLVCQEFIIVCLYGLKLNITPLFVLSPKQTPIANDTLLMDTKHITSPSIISPAKLNKAKTHILPP